MKKYLIVLMLLVNGGVAAQESTPATVQPTMQKIFSNMQDLMPYMVSEERFLDPENEGYISEKLKQSAVLVKNAKHASQLNSPTLKISREVLEDHFSEVERVFRVGNKSFARSQLSSTVPICMSCHTQSPSASRHWELADLLKGTSNEFEKAELLFMGRDFNSALELYNEVILGFPENDFSLIDVEKSLERKVVIYARVKRDFDGGIKDLEGDLNNNKNLPEYLTNSIKAWVSSFQIQEKQGYPDPVTSDDSAIEQYVEREMKEGLSGDNFDASNPGLVRNLTVSGVLYEYLNTHPQTTLEPEILNWLAILDNELRDTLFYSLADLYLKQCMSEFAAHPAAKKCYEQYKTITIISYSGSGGTHLPADVTQELRDWSIKIYGVDNSGIE